LIAAKGGLLASGCQLTGIKFTSRFRYARNLSGVRAGISTIRKSGGKLPSSDLSCRLKEGQLRNRCADNAPSSEAEHTLNNRIEVKVKKVGNTIKTP
jgi:hypothetical protein